MPESITFDLHSHVLERKVNSAAYWREASRLKIDVMAITEHAHFSPKKAFDVASQQKPKNKILIPGIELNTSIGHVLCLAPNQSIYEEKKFSEYDLSIEEAAALAEKYGAILSCAHPWGFQHDSAGFLVGAKRLTKMVKKYGLGIEAYNGMVGHLSDIAFESGWIRRPVNFLGFLEKNRVTQKIGLSRIGKVLSRRVENSIWNSLSRINAGIKLGEQAPFITAGSDAHIAERIGEGMLKIRAEKRPETVREAFDLLTQKENVTWCGVGVTETAPGVYKKVQRKKIARSELWDGIKYATRRTISEKVWKKIRRKKKQGVSEAEGE